MRVYVTGARGFVGRRLVAQLLARGHTVLGAEHETDVCDAAAVRIDVARSEPDAVVHLAAQSSVAASFDDPDACYRVNHDGSRHVLEAVERGARTARVLLVGSADQYGGQEPGAPPLRESDPLRPSSPYARSKTAAEELGQRFRERGGNVVMTRSFNHTGPGQSDRFVAPSFARQVCEIAAGQRPPQLRVGNLDSVRDFLHVDDVVDAYTALLEPTVAPGVYNVASGEAHSIRELLDALIAGAGVDPTIEVDPERVRPTDQLLGDATRLAGATGWRPRRGFDRMVRDLLEDWRGRVAAEDGGASAPA